MSRPASGRAPSPAGQLRSRHHRLPPALSPLWPRRPRSMGTLVTTRVAPTRPHRMGDPRLSPQRAQHAASSGGVLLPKRHPVGGPSCPHAAGWRGQGDGRRRRGATPGHVLWLATSAVACPTCLFCTRQLHTEARPGRFRRRADRCGKARRPEWQLCLAAGLALVPGLRSRGQHPPARTCPVASSVHACVVLCVLKLKLSARTQVWRLAINSHSATDLPELARRNAIIV
jgi:hypothetical protein